MVRRSDTKKPRIAPGLLHSELGVDSLKQSARPSISLTNLSPPEVSRHISTSLPDGTALAQVICGLLSFRVVANLHVTMQEASLVSEFVITTLVSSSSGRIVQANGTSSAVAGSIGPQVNAGTRASSATSGRLAKSSGRILPGYLPAAFLSASLIRSCQPGPPSWKCSSTS